MGIVDIAKGGMSSVSVASRIIIAHNRPGNHLDPSEADMELSQKIQDGAKLLDIEVLDHLMIIKDSFYSFTDHGQM